ncbi:MAG: alpha/beta hydrolase [Phycisphaerales bacterium]|nr:alpha/beta hydrolase [Phycisphaerales bacterium]
MVESIAPLLADPAAPPAFLSHWRGVMGRQSPAGIAAALRAMAGRPDSTDTLRAWRGRALVVVGEHDAITPVETHERMAGLLGAAELRVISGAGHLAPTERPEVFVSMVRGFLGV